jgi:hypothetical protein
VCVCEGGDGERMCGSYSQLIHSANCRTVARSSADDGSIEGVGWTSSMYSMIASDCVIRLPPSSGTSSVGTCAKALMLPV